ncbi:uncharacterized protein LOC127835460 [Dreissena polymorpha]|uniref:Uncharacterized protein n=1 Tax=Dreissena polymorpha TaxID=45954 RepID=A0A9D4GE57_DREPO|nr:uncharacterized protein LOC127835460 [Dreissena polymorpha]XP_052217866.1 uncharacterized protein LOC127835460 [Dreissena polymorpha]XP_052217867.1 uncharacterized protein LOC127835460 [Dreissena polymorpha]XP_052217869.1 uncharacterized protein LOC127835460 [Dreissena polymorpha]KAH3815153.1 hypothetical protein DPMN_143675 [Dreissena polymorpha]
MGDKDFQLDLQELVENYAWKRFTDELGCIKRLLHRRCKYYFDIPWGFVDFSHETTTTNERPQKESGADKNKVLYFSTFDNKSGASQKYTFTTERSTTATTSVEMQDNYTIGKEANLEIDLKGVKVGVGVNDSLSVTDTKCEVFSEVLTWNINTEINVPPWTSARATLNIVEEQSFEEFEVTTTISLPKGSLPVSIRRTKDNKIVKTYRIKNLRCIFTDKQKELVKLELLDVPNSQIKKVVAVIVSRGVCKSLSWKKQHVELQCSEIKPEANEARSATNVVD